MVSIATGPNKRSVISCSFMLPVTTFRSRNHDLYINRFLIRTPSTATAPTSCFSDRLYVSAARRHPARSFYASAPARRTSTSLAVGTCTRPPLSFRHDHRRSLRVYGLRPRVRIPQCSNNPRRSVLHVVPPSLHDRPVARLRRRPRSDHPQPALLL